MSEEKPRLRPIAQGNLPRFCGKCGKLMSVFVQTPDLLEVPYCPICEPGKLSDLMDLQVRANMKALERESKRRAEFFD